MKKKEAMKKCTGLFLAAAAMTIQVSGNWIVSASDIPEYAGTTQISTREVYPSVDTSAVELEVEEIYAEEGSQLKKGDPILKLTEESYQEALAYYEAAIIKAEGTLTDTQLEYDQGVLEEKYTFETAEADAENAEYIRNYQTSEVEDALTDHEEMLSEIDDRITELEEGISNGSYDASGTTTSGAASLSGSGTSGSGQKKNSNTKKQSETESEMNTEAGQSGETESGSTETDQPDEIESGSTEAGQPSETENGSTEAGQPSETENGSTEAGQPGETESGSTEAGQPGETESGSTEELRQELTTKMSEAETLAQTLTEKLKSAMEQTDTENVDSNAYTVYTEQLKNMLEQLEADIESQKKVESILEQYDFSSEDASQVTLSASITGDENVLSSLKEVQEKMTKYQTLINTVMNLWSTDSSTVLADSELLSGMSEYLSKQAEINELAVTLLEQYESTIQELKSEETTGSEEEKVQPGGTSNETTDSADGAGSMPGGVSGSAGSMGAGAAGNASGESGEDRETSGGEQGTETGLSGQNAQSSLSDEDISLLGDTYDLTSVKQLLSREPSDSDDAQDLIDELQDGRETTELQYEELQRKKKIFELEIQHTYDTAVIAGKLAELTYQENLSDWEETLAEARQNKAELETQKALLDAMTDGIIVADRDGTAASISYEAEELLSSEIPIVSYYDTDTVSIVLEVPQEEIASLSVGDTAEVTLAGVGRMEGTLTEKSLEPEDGTSRTTVNYTATVSLDNADGRLSDGLSATVTFAQKEKTKKETAK